MTLDIGTRKQVFLDWALIEPGYGVAWGGRPAPWEMPSGVRLTVHPPRLEREPLIVADQPWETMINVYTTLLQDGDRFRLYYEAYHYDPQEPRHDLKAILAVAESTDGIRWVKPHVGAIAFQGSRDNNLVYGLDLSLGRNAHGGTVFLDPSAPPEERYKLIHMGREEGVSRVFGAVSPDGLHWQPIREPLVDDYLSDTQTVVAYDAARGRYVGYFRGWQGQAPSKGAHGRRAIAYAESEDFRHWPRPQLLVGAEGSDPPDADIYTNGYVRWPGAADAHLLFPAFYRRALDVTEVHLLTSRDGTHWQRLCREALIPAGEPGSGWEGGVYAGCGLVSLRPGEWSLPIGPAMAHAQPGALFRGTAGEPAARGMTCRAVWREDGVTSLEAETEGQCSTVPLTFSGERLEINAWTRFGGEVRVELAEPTGEPVARAYPGRLRPDQRGRAAADGELAGARRPERLGGKAGAVTPGPASGAAARPPVLPGLARRQLSGEKVPGTWKAWASGRVVYGPDAQASAGHLSLFHLWPASLCLQLLLQKVALVPRREIAQLAENLVALLAIKVRRLEAKGVEVRIRRAPLPRLVLRLRQQAAAIPAAPQLLFDPQEVHKEPVPVRLTDHPARDGPVRRVEHQAEALAVRIAYDAVVVLADAAANGAPHRIIGVVHRTDRIPFAHRFGLSFLKCVSLPVHAPHFPHNTFFIGW